MNNKDFQDPFNAGQMVGMLVALKFVENNPDISEAALDKLRNIAAKNVEEYFERPAEDIHLMIDNLAKEL